MKQTAVEWLLENLNSEPYSEEEFNYNSDCWDRAKGMEKEQLCYFYIKGVEGEMSNPYITNIEFYNKTFKSKQ